MRFRALAVFACLATLSLAQTTRQSSQQAQTQPPSSARSARADDVHDVDSILRALYDTISGTAGQKRDWDRLRALFVPGARLIPAGKRPTGEVGARVLSIDEYIQRSEPFFAKEGFFESEVARRTEQYGHIAHAFSTYESRHAKNEKPFARGINSIQLFNDGKRWWVVTIYWEAETPDNPVPAKYLRSPK